MPYQNIPNIQLERDFRETSEHLGEADLLRLICQKAQEIAHIEAKRRGDISRDALFRLVDLMCGFHVSGAINGVLFPELCDGYGNVKPFYRAYFVHHFTYQYCMTLIATLSGIT